MHIRVETELGHLGYILSWSSGPDPLNKISGSDLDSTEYQVRWWWCLALVTMKYISQFCSRCFETGHWWWLYFKDTKGSRAWQQFWIVFNPVNNEAVFGVACCCMCKVCMLYKKKVKVEERSYMLDHLKQCLLAPASVPGFIWLGHIQVKSRSAGHPGQWYWPSFNPGAYTVHAGEQ